MNPLHDLRQAATDVGGEWREHTAGAGLINVLGMVLAAGVTVATLVLYRLVNGEGADFPPLAVFIAGFLVGIVLHEGVHGIGFRLAGARRDEVRFGVQWRHLMPYAHCSGTLPVRGYRAAAAAPGVLVGVLPLAVAIAAGMPWLTWLSLLLTVCAVGDVAILWMTRGLSRQTVIRDHPTAIGFLSRDSGA